jgi:hypothetical protein
MTTALGTDESGAARGLFFESLMQLAIFLPGSIPPETAVRDVSTVWKTASIDKTAVGSETSHRS